MSQQVYSRNREEPYPTSYGYGQGSNSSLKIPPVVETKQSQKKPVFINYYPSGNTNHPKKVIAQVETVTREVVKNPGPMVDPMKEIRNHHGDGQSKREDEFINKLRDETIKATADLNEASRIVEPKVLSPNLDQLQLSEQPRKHHGNGPMNDGWIEPADPNQPRKVAELMSRVSNWRGANGGARPISSDGYNKSGYRMSHDNGVNNGWNKMPAVRQGYEHTGYGGDSRRTTPTYRSEEIGYYNGNRSGKTDDVYTRRDDIVDPHAPPRASGVYGISGFDNGWNKMAPNVTPGYEHTGYGVDSRRTTPPRSEETGYYNGNRGGKTDGIYTRRDDIIDLHAPRATGGGYTSKSPPLAQQGRYDDQNPKDSRYAAYGSSYNPGMGNHNGRIEKVVEYDQVYGNTYNPGMPRSGHVGRAIDSGETSRSTVITSIDAVTKYKGTFVPLMRNGEQRTQHVPVKI